MLAPKYRKPVLRGEVGAQVRELVREICRSLDMDIIAGTLDLIMCICYRGAGPRASCLASFHD